MTPKEESLLIMACSEKDSWKRKAQQAEADCRILAAAICAYVDAAVLLAPHGARHQDPAARRQDLTRWRAAQVQLTKSLHVARRYAEETKESE